jgi:hypothetical protein
MDCAHNAEPTEWSPQLAYLTGLVISDGWLTVLKNRRRYAGFVSTSPELIDTTQTLLKGMNVSYGTSGGGTTKSGKPYQRVRWTDYPMWITFTQIGLMPNKSNIMGPLDLPRDQNGLSHFWLVFRGIFDGDGSIALTDTGSPREMRIVSGSPKFLTWLGRELYLRGVYKTDQMLSDKNKKAKILRISPYHTPLICQRMYKDYEKLGFADLGHPLKRERIYARQCNVMHRPSVIKRRLTLPKISDSIRLCQKELGHLPNTGEYDAIREKKITSLADPRDFPCRSAIHKHFSSWALMLETVAQETEAAPTSYIEPPKDSERSSSNCGGLKRR